MVGLNARCHSVDLLSVECLRRHLSAGSDAAFSSARLDALRRQINKLRSDRPNLADDFTDEHLMLLLRAGLASVEDFSRVTEEELGRLRLEKARIWSLRPGE